MKPSADQVLAEVVEDWRRSGPLEELLEIISEVWRTNLDHRYEPQALGDDAMSLGMQCSRNILNRCVDRFRGAGDEIVVRGGLTLEVVYGGRTMHFSKVSSWARSWDPFAIDWSSSDVRWDAAQLNATAYAPTEGTLFGGATGVALPGPEGDPTDLRYLHLAWQGLDDANTRVFVGFPTTGPVPWSAVTLVHDGGTPRGGLPIEADAAPAMPGLDALAEPALTLRRRTPPTEGTGRNSA